MKNTSPEPSNHATLGPRPLPVDAIRSLQICSWRNVPHSFSVVNEFQCLELLNFPELTLFHDEVPYMGAWQKHRSLSEADETRLDEIPGKRPRDPAEVVLRISGPFNFEPVENARLFVFGNVHGYQIQPYQFAGKQSFQETFERSGADIIAPSHWSRDGFLFSGVPENRVHVVPHGVSNRYFYPVDDDRKLAIRQRHGLGEQHFVFLHVGGMSANKGVDRILRAFAVVHAKFPNTRLLLKGTDEIFRSSEHLKRLMASLSPAERRSIENGVIYNGAKLSQMQLADLYRLSDVYVSPYLAEGFNIPVLEAAASGLPLICSMGGPTDEFTRSDFRLGISTARNNNRQLLPDQEELTGHMLSLLDDADFRAKARAAGPAFVNQHWSWARSVEKLLTVLSAGRPAVAEKFYIQHSTGVGGKANRDMIGEDTSAKQTFSNIYDTAMWGGGSGFGSAPKFTHSYRDFLQDFLERENISSVVDYGCGDWQYARMMDWNGIDYLGMDIVQSVIEKNQKHFTSDNIQFQLGNLIEDPIPDADLVIVKDVLQHLSFEAINRALEKLAECPRVLLVNDYYPVNVDCEIGDTRPINPVAAPFNLAATCVHSFFRKKAFLLTNPKQVFARESFNATEKLKRALAYRAKFDRHFIRTGLSRHEQVNLRGKPRPYIEGCIDLMRLLGGNVVVEVGTMRKPMPHGITDFEPECCNGGHSTFFWANAGFTVFSVDSDAAAVENATKYCAQFDNCQVICADGLEFLSGFDRKIDLLYLNAWDVIGGTPYAEKHLEAFRRAQDKLAPSHIIAIDDTDVAYGGKGRLLTPCLVEEGYEIIAVGRQTIAIKQESTRAA